MAKPDRSTMIRILAVALTTALLLLPLLLQAEPAAEEAEPLPAPPLEVELELDTEVTVFPTLVISEAMAPDGAVPLVEAPPVVEGTGVIGHLLPEAPGALDEHEESSSEPAPDVPTVVTAPADPIVPPPTTQLSVTLDWYLNPQHATLLIAREKGMFLRRGLDVALVVPADPNVPAKLLAAGRTDLALGRQTQLHLLVDSGMPLVRIATLIAAPVSGLMLRANADSEKQDLAVEGMRIGYTDADGRDAMLQSVLSELLGTVNGLDLVELKDTNYAMLDAMRAQDVDGMMMHHRYLLPRQLADEGIFTHTLPIEEFGLPLHDGLILMANRDQLNGKRDALRRFVSALEEAALWIVNHPREAWELLEKAEPALADPINREAWAGIAPRFSLQPAAVDKGRYLRLEQYLLEAGIIEVPTPLERLAIDLGTATP
ncbi:ABC transporter substrate-binding protein [Halomonas sp. MCCC 1A11062]|uniref:ABC transporter substrate-binding protein n=1 Tax=Halomonas sp. MCCC 1A11062 TaxID=2733485 RepID=UPI001F284AF3|nr:ABC transporter substrate-binding protein [Halomonas sp. MCCC 1A11062]MCE8038161.1 ABC transporter substrate-binding protein [Halomonas sp. MCCC 1A11062]